MHKFTSLLYSKIIAGFTVKVIYLNILLVQIKIIIFIAIGTKIILVLRFPHI